MKLIFSRKGFDSANGGCPSPVLDGRLCSLPIPDAGASTRYREISSFNGSSTGRIVEDLTRGRIERGDGAHLDPDLRRDSIARTAGWRPIFGQAAAAQSHLSRHGITQGDLFLFFGCFRCAEKVEGAFRFVGDAPKLHVIFGWLQVGKIARATDGLVAEIPWAEGHPHLDAPDRYKNNTLYLASDRLSSIGLKTKGAGTFDRIRPELILTATNSNCSEWQLPRWFAPAERTPLSYHANPARWTDCSTSTRLQSVGRGQEFVLDVEQYPESRAWLRSIFRAATR